MTRSWIWSLSFSTYLSYEGKIQIQLQIQLSATPQVSACDIVRVLMPVVGTSLFRHRREESCNF